nr:hypothetical protein [Tanacetum cinerariifolium]
MDIEKSTRVCKQDICFEDTMLKKRHVSLSNSVVTLRRSNHRAADACGPPAEASLTFDGRLAELGFDDTDSTMSPLSVSFHENDSTIYVFQYKESHY